jgi:hypothetical protein
MSVFEVDALVIGCVCGLVCWKNKWVLLVTFWHVEYSGAGVDWRVIFFYSPLIFLSLRLLPTCLLTCLPANLLAFTYLHILTLTLFSQNTKNDKIKLTHKRNKQVMRA